MTLGARYPSGFVCATAANGARFTAPGKGANIFGAASSALLLSLDGGGLASAITNAFVLSAQNRVQGPSLPNKLTPSFNASTGLFQGGQVIPGTKQAVAFTGVVVQGQTNGAGHFLGAEQSGGVTLRRR